MLCDECGEREAVVTLTSVTDDLVGTEHLCAECATARRSSAGSGATGRGRGPRWERNTGVSYDRYAGFTEAEWVAAHAFVMPDAEAAAGVRHLFAEIERFGSNASSVGPEDWVLLSYVSEDCRARVLAAVE